MTSVDIMGRIKYQSVQLPKLMGLDLLCIENSFMSPIVFSVKRSLLYVVIVWHLVSPFVRPVIEMRK